MVSQMQILSYDQLTGLLRKVIQDQGLTQYEVAEMTGYKQPFISRLVSTDTPAHKYLDAKIKVLTTLTKKACDLAVILH